MADTKITDLKAAPAASKPGSLSAEAAYAAAASATKVAEETAKAAPVATKTAATPTAAKTTATAKPAATATAKPAAAKKTAAKKPAAKKTVRKMAVKPTVKKTVTKGTKKMATNKTTAKKPTATKRVVKNTKAANTKAANKAKNAAENLGGRFENLTADAQLRAKEVADRAVKASKSAVEFNRENIDALIESGKITAKGAQELAKTNMKYTRENMVEASRNLQGLFSVSTPRDFFEKQVDYTRQSLDRVVDQASNNLDAVKKIAGKASKPVAKRFETVRKELKKAA